MKSNLLIVAAAASLLVACTSKEKTATAPRKKAPVISVKFSPNGGAETALVAGIDEAKKEVLLQAYSFTAMAIAEALVRAQNRGASVLVIVDREATGNPHSVVPFLMRSGVTVHVDGQHAIAHNKIIIIDEKTTFTGSYNFSEGANKKNAENSIRIDDIPTALLYKENWSRHQEHSPLHK